MRSTPFLWGNPAVFLLLVMLLALAGKTQQADIIALAQGDIAD